MELDPICDPKYLYDEGGYDLSVIHWMLSLTPAERLDMLEEMLDLVEQVEKYNAAKPIHRSPSGSE
jgi:hypothetical protein